MIWFRKVAENWAGGEVKEFLRVFLLPFLLSRSLNLEKQKQKQNTVKIKYLYKTPQPHWESQQAGNRKGREVTSF